MVSKVVVTTSVVRGAVSAVVIATVVLAEVVSVGIPKKLEASSK